MGWLVLGEKGIQNSIKQRCSTNEENNSVETLYSHKPRFHLLKTAGLGQACTFAGFLCLAFLSVPVGFQLARLAMVHHTQHITLVVWTAMAAFTSPVTCPQAGAGTNLLLFLSIPVGFQRARPAMVHHTQHITLVAWTSTTAFARHRLAQGRTCCCIDLAVRDFLSDLRSQ